MPCCSWHTEVHLTSNQAKQACVTPATPGASFYQPVHLYGGSLEEEFTWNELPP